MCERERKGGGERKGKGKMRESTEFLGLSTQHQKSHPLNSLLMI